MPATKTIRALLTSGCRWSKQGVCQVVDLIESQPRKLPQLVECLWDPDPFVANGAADALERLTRERPSILDPWKDALLGLLAETREKHVRWNLALTIPRMKLSRSQCRRAKAVLESYLDDRSSVVKTSALHGLADLVRQDPGSLREVVDLLQIAGPSGTPAMRARSRILLAQLENPAKRQSNRVSLHMFT